MKKTLTHKTIIFVTMLLTAYVVSVSAQTTNKIIYVPSSFGSMDLNNESSQWCYNRSMQSDNFIVFWEAGFGSNPKTTSNSSYQVDVDALLNIAEKSFKFYRDSLKFIIKDNSQTDTYKMIILLRYSTTWQASGSGVDDMIGLLTLSASGAQALGSTVAHEVGHCFQYQVHCDGHQGGWMYGFGGNGSGGNCWWEQCAQWQAFKVLPDEQFSNYNFSNYLKNAHKHILHESPRYANYFIQDYWTYLHGLDFIGKLWQESKSPEDPVEAYKRMTQISQDEFNDEMYNCASRFVTWDIPSIREYGKNYIDVRESSPMTVSDNNYWLIDSSKCIENYGYNTIRLNAPEKGKSITVYFEGKSGDIGFRSYNKDYAGWRYGIVALKEDGTREYSPIQSASYDISNLANPKDTFTFVCAENYARLWLVVTGAPTIHWRHAWDDDATNDEQWPYQVKFENTNLYGIFDFKPEDVPTNVTISNNLTLTPITANTNPYPSTPLQPNWESVCKAFCLQLSEIKSAFGSSIKYCAINPDETNNFNSTANAPGHWFNNNGYTTNWGNNSYIFSEFNINNSIFNIGQYPNKCKNGDHYTICQGLVYTPLTGNSVTAKFIFNISIVSNEISTGLDDYSFSNMSSPLKNTMVKDILYLNKQYKNVTIYNINGRIIKQVNNVNQINLNNLPTGIYLVYIEGVMEKIYKTPPL